MANGIASVVIDDSFRILQSILLLQCHPPTTQFCVRFISQPIVPTILCGGEHLPDSHINMLIDGFSVCEE